MTVNRHTLRVITAQQMTVGRAMDNTTAKLIDAWMTAWNTIANDLDSIVNDLTTVSGAIRHKKTTEALAILSKQYEELCREAGVTISRDAEELIRQAVDDADELMASQLPTLGANLLRVSADQVDAIVRRTTQQVTVRQYYLQRAATKAMKKQLAIGVTAGDNPRKTADRMVKAVRGEFNGGLTRALVIARTEQIDAYRAATEAEHNANADVLSGWQWVTSLSSRTCASCLAQHGSIHPLDEPGPQDHHQGRCTRVPITKTWEELGFTGIKEPPRAINPGDGVRWLKDQPEDVQRHALPGTRYQAWKAGDYPPDAWSAVREAPEWRPSIGLSPAPH